MNLYKTIANLLISIIGVVFLIASISLGLGTIWSPGPGLVPFMAAGLLILLSFGVALEDRLKKSDEKQSVRVYDEKKRKKMALLVVLSLFGYLIVMKLVGFRLSTFLLLVFLFKVPEKQSWKVVITVALLTMAGTYLIFDYFLRINFPKGIYGF
jgi:putative tricarboxylic transport membrane protein